MRALQELYKIYAVLADPDDRIALYGALTSRAIGLTREELLAFRSKGGEISLSSTFDVKNSKSEKVLKVAAKLEELKSIVCSSQNMSPAALLSSILDQFKIYTFAEARNLEIIYYTLELLRSAEKSGIVVTLKDGKAYLHELLSGESEIERCLSLNDEENSVHIANLHKVKGLEAPIIILDWAQAGGSSPNIRIDYKEDSTEAYLFALQRANREDGYCFSTEQFPDEKDQEKGALEAEELRKIYVAATRARNALFVCTYGGGKSRWKYLDPTSLTGISTFLSAKDVTTWEMGEKADPVELYRQADETCVFCNRNAEEPTFRMQNPSRLSVTSKVSEDKEIPGSEDEAETDYALAIDPEYEKDKKGNGEGKQAFTVVGNNSTSQWVTNGSTLGEAAEAECAPEEDDHTEEADEDVNADDRVIRIEVDGQMTEDEVEELAGMLGLKIYSSEGAGDYVLIGENGISDELLAQAIRVFKENAHIKNMQVDKLPLK